MGQLNSEPYFGIPLKYSRLSVAWFIIGQEGESAYSDSGFEVSLVHTNRVKMQ